MGVSDREGTVELNFLAARSEWQMKGGKEREREKIDVNDGENSPSPRLYIKRNTYSWQQTLSVLHLK